MYLSVPSIAFVYVFCMSDVTSSFKSFETWITCVCSPYVVSLCDFAYYVVGQEPAVAMHLSLWYVLLVCHQYDVCKDYVSSVYVGG